MKILDRNTLEKTDIEAMSHDEIVSLVGDLIHDNNILIEAVKALRHDKYGSKSEKTEAILNQLSLFDEVELLQEEKDEIEEADTSNNGKRGRKKTSVSNPNLEVVEIVHTMDELINDGYQEIGRKESEQLRYRPAKVWIERNIYPVYEKELEYGETDIQTKYKCNQFLKGSNASPEIVSCIINSKYIKHLPLYRMEKVFDDLGASIPRMTMSNWLVASCNKYLDPIAKKMKEHLLSRDSIHADETTVQVLKHQDGSTNKKSYMWVYRSNKHDPTIIIYDYNPSRGFHVVDDFLGDYSGYLQSDGYEAYKKLNHVIQVGCLAHGRRKIVDVINKVDKNSTTSKDATKILRSIRAIYKVEKSLKDKTPEECFEMRLEKSKPLFLSLKEQLLEIKDKTLPKSTLGEAINYNLNQFESFERVFLDGRLAIDNNLVENSIRPFTLGRKNWIFSNTTRGAKTSATIYTVVQSARENGLRIEPYLNHIFNTLSNIDPKDWNEELIEALLPHSECLPNEIYTSKSRSK